MKKLKLIALSLFATTGLLASCGGNNGGVGADYTVDMSIDTRGVNIECGHLLANLLLVI